MLLPKIYHYHDLTPTQLVEQLPKDMADPLFMKVLMATFNDVKYRLKPEQFSAYLSGKKAPQVTTDTTIAELTVDWPGWLVLDAMGSGDLSGDTAKGELALAYLPLSLQDREVVMLVLDKTWRNGVTQDKINLARPGTFRPAKFMLAHNVEDVKPENRKYPYLATYKYDGFRGIHCQDSGRCLSRNGNPYPMAPRLSEQLRELGVHLQKAYGTSYVPAIDGELFKGNWSDTAKARALGYDAMVVFGMLPSEMIYGGVSEAFDVVEFLETVDTYIAGLQLDLLSTPIRKVVSNDEEMEAFYQEALAAGYEGLILTAIVRPYEGKRSRLWLKRKPADPLDLPITGVILGEARSKNEGKVVGVRVTREGVESGVSGMKQELIDKCSELHAEGHLVTTPALIAEVVIHELTPDGALRHGRVKAIRFDK